MVRIAASLGETGAQRRHDPPAVDEPEEVGQSEREPRIERGALAIALEQVVDHLGDGVLSVGALKRLGQGARQGAARTLDPAVLPGEVEAGRHQRCEGLSHQQPLKARDDLAGRGRWQLPGDPAQQHARDFLEVTSARPLRGPRDERGDVELGKLLGKVLAREHAVTDHRSHARGQHLPVAGNQAGVRNRQSEGTPEQRGHREPVGEAADDPGLRNRADPAAPPGRPERVGHDREPGRGQQDREGQPPLWSHRRYSRRKSSMRSVALGPGGYVCVPRMSPPLHA